MNQNTLSPILNITLKTDVFLQLHIKIVDTLNKIKYNKYNENME